MADSLTVKNWNEEDRPREKLSTLGAEALTTAELLAILIGSGQRGLNVVDLTRMIVSDCGGSLRRLGRMSLEDLTAYPGIGEAKAITLLAACELARRRAAEPAEEKLTMENSAKIYNYFAPKLEDKPTEEFYVMLLTQRLTLMKSVCVAHGGLTSTTADIRIILREALLQKAPIIVVCHNHPSGNPKPSAADDKFTQKVKEAANMMDIRLLDHVIVGQGAYYSYQEQGKL